MKTLNKEEAIKYIEGNLEYPKIKSISEQFGSVDDFLMYLKDYAEFGAARSMFFKEHGYFSTYEQNMVSHVDHNSVLETYNNYLLTEYGVFKITCSLGSEIIGGFTDCHHIVIGRPSGGIYCIKCNVWECY